MIERMHSPSSSFPSFPPSCSRRLASFFVLLLIFIVSSPFNHESSTSSSPSSSPFLSFSIVQYSQALEVLSSEYVVQEGTVVGDYFKVATFRAEFDEQLYLQSGLYCPVCELPEFLKDDNDDEEVHEELLDIACVCDYTGDDDECGSLKPISSKYTAKCEKLERRLGGKQKACTQKEELCGAKSKPISFQSPLPGHLNQDKARNYSVLITSPCHLYQIELQAIYGDPDIIIYLATSNETVFVKISRRYGPEDFALCPSDLGGRLGTLILEIEAYQDPTTGADMGAGTNFTLIGTPQRVPPALDKDRKPNPCVQNENITCLFDDEAWFPDYYTFAGTNSFSFTLPAGKGCRKFVISAGNPFIVSDKVETPTLDSYDDEATVLATAIGGNTVVINQCEEEEKTWYIGLQVETFGDFIVVSTRGIIKATPFSELTQHTAIWKLFGTTKISCGNLTNYCSSFVWDCNYYTPLYGDRPNPFWPRYPSTHFYPKYNRLYLLEDLPTISHSRPAGTVFASAVLIRAVVGADTFDPSLFSRFEQETLSSCKVTWGSGQITDVNGTPFLRPVTFHNASSKCDRENYNKMSSEITEALEDETELFGESLVLHNFYLDQLGFTSEFQTCLNFGSEHLLRKKNNTHSLTSSKCYLSLRLQREHDDDPCCQPYLQWSAPCKERNITLDVSIFEEEVAEVDRLCYDPDCTSTYVVDYGRANEILDDPFVGCTTIDENELANDEVTWIPYNECRRKFLGRNATEGIHCRQDDDCYTGRCDLLRYRCLIPIEEQEERFLICISTEISPLVLFAVQETLGLKSSVGTHEFGIELRDKLSKSDCATDFDFAVEHRTSMNLATPAFKVCSDSCPDSRCWDLKCEVPIVCRQYNDRPCYKKFALVEGKKDDCLADYFCNWSPNTCDDSISSCTKQCEKLPDSDHFCGLCENEQDCLEFEGVQDQATCEKKEVCILADGSVDSESSKQECEETFQCTDPCYRDGKEVECGKEDCNRNGLCEGADLFLEPKCVVSSVPYFFQSCEGSSILQPAIDSSLGCVSLETTTKEECRDSGDPDWKWVKYEESTREGCDAVGGYGCWEVVSFPRYQGNFMFTNKTRKECGKTTGEWKPRLEFTPSRWISGTMRPLKWKKREYSPRRKWVDSTLDFPKLQQTIESAIQTTISDRRRTESRCRFEGRLAALNTITCNCKANNEGEMGRDTLDICRARSSISGFGRVCPSIPDTILVPPANVFFGKEAVQGSACVEVTISVTSVLEFQSYQVENFASSFVEPPYVSNSFSFTNDEGITIGQVIADAFIIKSSSEGSLNENNITSCVGTREEEIEIDNKFTLFDFGVVRGDKIVPLKRSDGGVEKRKGLGYCLLETPQNQQLIPILLLPDWESASRFSDSSTILLSTLVGLFWLVVLFGVFQLTWGFLISHHRFLYVHWLIVVLMAFCLLRGLYFLLLLENVIQSRFVDYFLTELPTFIYFSAFTVIIFSWADVTSKTKQMRTTQKNLLGILIMIVGNAFVYGIFTMFMILFGLYGTDTVDAPCEGRVPPGKSELFNEAQYAIAIAYHSWITAVAIILVIVIVVVGWRLLRLLGHSSGVLGRTEKNQRRKRIILSIIMTCSVTFLAHTIWVLVLVTTKFRNTILAFCLLVAIEVIPIAYLIFILSPRATARKRGDSDFSQRSTITQGASTITLSGVKVSPDKADVELGSR